MLLPRLIATDLDGTLLDHRKELTPRTVAAVRAVMAAGIGFVLVTARPPRTVGHLAEQLGGRIAALCGNGTILAEFDTSAAASDQAASAGTLTFIRSFAASDAVAIVEQLKPVFPEAGFAIETGLDVYFETGFGLGSVTDERRVLTDSLAAIAPQMRSIIKILARSGQRTADDMVALAAEKLTVQAEVSHSGGAGLLEIAPLGASKASALAWLCERRGIDAADVAAFGDMPNDLPMLRWAGRGYAVANAHDEVLAAADHVVGHHAEDGVALALEMLLDGVSKTSA
ncbi:HAD family phosphatase [Actinospica sp. MGRD01-02]|uniref:HAD family phosphatase n=1 Tax=Actinospica acidithermotolerans TaxID=2828514 RepID=A0A941EGD1_9ACTN|nr:HAD family hydrolase [Actinospica acidithermotolerans]MBR7827164.1 HAD family phosphatase [Actinospica acidithermotolerans]